MLEMLYDLIESQETEETPSVMDFIARFATGGDAEEMFLVAVRDTRLAGFKAGVKAMVGLLREVS